MTRTDAPQTSQLRRRPANGLRWLSSLWGRSLQLRVAATTLVVAGAVVFIVGVFLNNHISSGVLRSKQRVAQAQAVAGINAVTVQLQSYEIGDVRGVRTLLSQLNVTSGLASAGSFSTSVRSADPNIQQALASQPDVPPELRSAVSSGTLAMQYAPIAGPHGSTVPGLIVGGRVTSRVATFELYYLFPLTSERDTIALVQRTVALSGIGLVLLVAAIAMLVARQVVGPVRVAALSAERLAAGDLEQRIAVRGDDELALLGRSFNGMAESLQRQFQRLEELSVLQQRFTSDVSHELRTPLTTVRMAAEVLGERRDEFSPDLARSVELLNTELDRFENLLGDLLEISRYDAGVARLDLEHTDIGGLVRRVVEASRPLADRQGSELIVTLPADPIAAYVDPRRVERIIRNLVVNAVDHGEHRPVEIQVAADDTAVAVLVRDEGVGLRPGEAQLVFNRFWRGDPSRSRLTGGTGLGLAIGLEDARLHDGWLQAAGVRGEGAAFRLTLPLRAGVKITRSPIPMPFPEDEPAGVPE